MKLVVLTGTQQKGVTYHMKELFLSHFGEDTTITEYGPKDMPPFCMGCKNCFLRGEETCPHAEKVMPIWKDFLDADLIVFAYPIYALRTPASIKSLLDHFCVHWMVHRPDEKIFKKTGVILTNSIGAPNGSAIKDVKTSLSWMGVSKIYSCGAQMMGDIVWDKMSEKHKKMLAKKTTKLYRKVRNVKPVTHKSLLVKLKFIVCQIEHKGILKTEETPGLDTKHFLDRGWITR